MTIKKFQKAIKDLEKLVAEGKSEEALRKIDYLKGATDVYGEILNRLNSDGATPPIN